MKEINQPWPHAQNDALGGFLWFYCKLAREGVLPVAPSDWRMLARFADYFRAIRYWQDEDSGHWEETRKIEASSIGMVVAGFEQLRLLIRASGDSVSFRRGGHRFNMEVIDESIKQGTVALKAILPFECIQPDPLKNRRYDAALLFLIHPLELISGSLADRVLRNVITQLGGDYGIRRYRGDSYWAPDYDQKLPPDEQIGDFSEDISGRNLLLTGKGSEAQWCIFDPVISCIYGLKFARTGRNEFLDLQTFHLNRSLAQLTRGDRSRDIRPFRCPELYYLKNGEYVPNDHLPLLWTQANLLMALKMLRNNLREHASRQGSIQKI
jgi:phosphorylase kinase alpha/beta subunit